MPDEEILEDESADAYGNKEVILSITPWRLPTTHFASFKLFQQVFMHEESPAKMKVDTSVASRGLMKTCGTRETVLKCIRLLEQVGVRRLAIPGGFILQPTKRAYKIGVKS